jgi:hypothetical protein
MLFLGNYDAYMSNSPEHEHLNWIDPDLLAYDINAAVDADKDGEKEFKKFFEVGWLDPSFDDIRERWDPLLHAESPGARVLAKTALWSVKRLREIHLAADESKKLR